MLRERKKSQVLTNIIQNITEKDRLDMRETMFLAARIDDLRREKGLTLSDLAEKLNIAEEEMGENGVIMISDAESFKEREETA